MPRTVLEPARGACRTTPASTKLARSSSEVGRVARAAIVIACAASVFWVTGPSVELDAQQAPGACRISGRATSGGTALPGVSMVVRSGDAVKTATSSDTDGTYRLSLPPGAYRVTAELTGFETVARELTVGAAAAVEPALSERTDQASRRAPCDQTVDFLLSLAPRVPRAATATPAPGTPQPPSSGRGAQPAAGVAAPGAQRFETLTVQTQAAAAAGIESNDAPDEARLLLPPGFSSEGPTQALAINGNMASIDRGMLNDRLEAIGRGEFNPATGEFGQGFGPGRSGRIRRTRRTRRTRRLRRTGRTRRSRRTRWRSRRPRRVRARRPRARAERRTTSSPTTRSAARRSTAAPYQLRPGSDAQQRPYSRQNFGVTFGGPVRIPGVYKGDRRTNFTASYTGSRGGDLFDQYATVPTESMRGGDFGSLATPVLRSADRPAVRRQPDSVGRHSSASALSLLRFLPLPNLDGTTPQLPLRDDERTRCPTASTCASRTTSRRPRGAAAGPAAGAAAGAAAPGARGRRARRPRAAQGTSVNMTTQLQYRRNDNDQVNVFPTLGGQNIGSSLTVPVVAQHSAPPHEPQRQRQLLAHVLAIAEPIRLRRRRRRGRRHHAASPPIRSTGACRSCRSRASRACAT